MTKLLEEIHEQPLLKAKLYQVSGNPRVLSFPYLWSARDCRLQLSLLAPAGELPYDLDGARNGYYDLPQEAGARLARSGEEAAAHSRQLPVQHTAVCGHHWAQP